MACCSTRGPCAAVSRGRKAAQRESAGCRLLFASTWMCCRKARRRLTDLPGRKPGKRQAGWPSLLVTFLLATQEKSDSRAEGARKPLPLIASGERRNPLFLRTHDHHSPPSVAGSPASASRICALLAIAVILAT